MKTTNSTLLGMAILAALSGPLVLPARATVSEAESGAHVSPPAARNFHRRSPHLTIMGPVIRTHGQWKKSVSPWTDPSAAYVTAPQTDNGVAVIEEPTPKNLKP